MNTPVCCSQHGTGVSVEAVDSVFQTNMLDMLKQTGALLPCLFSARARFHRVFSFRVLVACYSLS